MKKSMTAVDTAVVILIFGITAVLAIVFVKYYMEVNVPTPIANPSETARFVRYMTCAIAACSGGCDSSMTFSLSLEYGKGNQPTLGCNQLLHELGYCTGVNSGQKLCSKNYYLNFTFKEDKEVYEYTGNYSVSMSNLGPCNILKQGWQTDASCLGNWEDYMPCPCYKCNRGGTINIAGGEPAGKLLVNNNGCEQVPASRVYGAIWIPNTMVGDDIPGKCVKGVGSIDPTTDLFFKGHNALAWCNFEKKQTIYIWATDVDSIRDECIAPLGFFLGCCSSLSMARFLCDIPTGFPLYTCPQIMICDSKP